MKKICFYRENDEYGYFSNFSPHPITLKGKSWPTSEHYFQAQKFSGTSHEEEIRQTSSPMSAARLGRDRQKPLRSDWEQVKDEIMLKAVRAKFTQHPDLRAKLLATGNAELVEHTKNDAYWGDGGDGTGKNMLGRILMKVREELQATEQRNLE
jgi:ribA/ribD-fused uncharacterized protein